MINALFVVTEQKAFYKVMEHREKKMCRKN